jgi:putative PIN family toxin of toxin-antitoxin system
MKNKTVFDTNIWISFFISHKTEQIIDMIERNNVILYRSDQLTEELKTVLQRNKFRKYFSDGIENLMLLYEGTTEFYSTISTFENCSDPKDNYLFDLAYQTASHYLVSGDRHVLSTPVKSSLNLLLLSDFKNTIGFSNYSDK